MVICRRYILSFYKRSQQSEGGQTHTEHHSNTTALPLPPHICSLCSPLLFRPRQIPFCTPGSFYPSSSFFSWPLNLPIIVPFIHSSVLWFCPFLPSSPPHVHLLYPPPSSSTTIPTPHQPLCWAEETEDTSSSGAALSPISLWGHRCQISLQRSRGKFGNSWMGYFCCEAVVLLLYLETGDAQGPSHIPCPPAVSIFSLPSGRVKKATVRLCGMGLSRIPPSHLMP